MEDNNINNNNGNKIRKVLFNEVSLITGVVAITIGIVLFITGPDAEVKQDVAIIKRDIEIITQNVNKISDNELVHIQDSINKSNEKTDENAKRINDICIKLERVLTILGE